MIDFLTGPAGGVLATINKELIELSKSERSKSPSVGYVGGGSEVAKGAGEPNKNTATNEEYEDADNDADDAQYVEHLEGIEERGLSDEDENKSTHSSVSEINSNEETNGLSFEAATKQETKRRGRGKGGKKEANAGDENKFTSSSEQESNKKARGKGKKKSEKEDKDDANTTELSITSKKRKVGGQNGGLNGAKRELKSAGKK